MVGRLFVCRWPLPERLFVPIAKLRFGDASPIHPNNVTAGGDPPRCNEPSILTWPLATNCAAILRKTQETSSSGSESLESLDDTGSGDLISPPRPCCNGRRHHHHQQHHGHGQQHSQQSLKSGTSSLATGEAAAPSAGAGAASAHGVRGAGSAGASLPSSSSPGTGMTTVAANGNGVDAGARYRGHVNGCCSGKRPVPSVA